MSIVADAFSNSSLRLIVMPTEKCNYRCTYCYEDFKIGKMKEAVVDSLVSFVKLRVPSLKVLDISWFGGEPLLAFDVIEKVMTQVLPDCHTNNVAVRSGMSTNGHLLTPDVFEKAISLSLRTYQITLDGAEPFHNARRLVKSRSGDFQKIYDNMLYMCSTLNDFYISLRLHVDKNNAASIPDLLKNIESVSSDSRVCVSFERVKYLGGELPADIAPMTKSEFADYVRNTVTRNDLHGIRFDDVLSKVDEHVCYAALPDNFVVRADGRLQKCTVALGNEINTVGFLDGDSISLNDHYAKWLSVWGMDSSWAVACPAKAIAQNH